MKEIALFLYDQMTALDAVGPYEVLSRMEGAAIKFVATSPGPKRTDAGLLLTADIVPSNEVTWKKSSKIGAGNLDRLL